MLIVDGWLQLFPSFRGAGIWAGLVVVVDYFQAMAIIARNCRKWIMSRLMRRGGSICAWLFLGVVEESATGGADGG